MLYEAVRVDLDELVGLGDGVDGRLLGVGQVQVRLPDAGDHGGLVDDQVPALLPLVPRESLGREAWTGERGGAGARPDSSSAGTFPP